MTIALGHYALWLAGALALIQAVIPALLADERRACAIAVSAAKTQAALFTLSIAALACGFLANDFSVRYIAAHSNNLLPWYYRATAVWGGHEGSLLLWITILAWWAAAFAVKSRDLPDAVRGKTLAILGYISVGFTGFIGFTSNPFTRILPAPFDGADLNPLLQDPGLILHPPLLYTGYVGFAVAYAIVLANLWQGRLDTLSLRRARPWTLAAWCALTLGIALGSYWAYYELGWGGWWFWDPVENASLMPWLIGAALIHSLIVSEKRGDLRTWTALLAISAFTLSLIGTFLVRSGVLTSVHAFAADPTRGVYILALIVANTLPALILLILRAPQLASEARHSLLARETGILANNCLPHRLHRHPLPAARRHPEPRQNLRRRALLQPPHRATGTRQPHPPRRRPAPALATRPRPPPPPAPCHHDDRRRPRHPRHLPRGRHLAMAHHHRRRLRHLRRQRHPARLP